MTEVELRLTADTGNATKSIGAFTKEYQSLVRAVEKPLKQIDALQKAQLSAKTASSAYFEARRRVEELKNSIEQAGQPVKDLDRAYAQAQRTLASATREFDRQKAKVREQRAELKAAGVDTRNLATEQQRLQAELSKASASGTKGLALQAATDGLGVGRYRALQAELTKVQQQYRLLRSSGTLTTRELAIAQQTYTQRVRETLQAMKGVEAAQRQSRLGGGAGALAAQFGGAYGAVRGLQGIVRISDSWTELSDRIKLAAGSQEDYQQGMERLRDISDRTFTSMRGNAETFVNSLSPLRGRGFTNPEVLSFVEAVGLGMVASAAKGERAASVMQQFSNALQDGKLQGDAFQAMVRNTPALADALAASLGRTREELAKMASEGLLTTDVWVPALIAQVENLGKAVDDMNITVGDALTRLNNAWEDAIGKADTEPLVRAIQDLTETISDPLIVENLVKIASAMVYLASAGVSAASGFATLGDEIGYAAAKASGNVDKLTKLEKTLKEVNNAITGDSFIGSNTVAQLLKHFDPEGLLQWRKQLEDEIAKVGAEISGMSVDSYKAQQEAARQQRELERQALEEQKKIDQQELTAKREKFTELAKLRDAEVKASADAVKARAKAEREALTELEKAKRAQLDTEIRYKEALERLHASGTGQASFGTAMNLRSAARQALRENDFEQAKRNAQAALKMLMDLAAAGENTYGFEGFIKSLKDIEDQADRVNLDQAKSSFEQAQKQTADLKALLDSLKDTTITVTMDQGALARVHAQLQELATLTGRPIDPAGPPNPSAAPSPTGIAPYSGSTSAGPAGRGAGSTSKPSSAGAEMRPAGIRQDGTNSWTNLPAVEVAVAPQGIRQDGPSSWSNLPPVEVAVLPKGVRQDGENSFTNLPPLDVELQVDQEAASLAQSQVAELAQQLKRQLVIPIIPVAGPAGSAPADQVDGYASGGLIRGPGSGTSDSILARLSNGEFVMRADAVKHYGPALLQRINTRQLPKFAEGGLVSNAILPSVPPMAHLVEGKANANQGMDLADYGRVALDPGNGREYEVIMHRSAVDELRLAARKYGRTHGRGVGP